MSFIDTVIGLIQANDENLHPIQASLVGHEAWVKETRGSVLLWWCCVLNRSKTLSMLLQQWGTALDVNQTFSFNGESGWTPLVVAILSNASAVLSVLLEHSADWSATTVRPELLRLLPTTISANTYYYPPTTKKPKKQRAALSNKLAEGSFPVSWLPIFCGHDDIYRVLIAHHGITAADIAWPTLLDLLSQHPTLATRFHTYIASYLSTWQSQYETPSSIAQCYAPATMTRWLLYAVTQRHSSLIRILSQRLQTLSRPPFVWSIATVKTILPAIATVDMYPWLIQWFPIDWSRIPIASRVQWLQSTVFAAPKVYPSTASDVFGDLGSPWAPRAPYLIAMIHDMFHADGHLGVVFHREKVAKRTQAFCDALYSTLSLFDLWRLRDDVDLVAECVVAWLDTYPVAATAETIAAEVAATAAAEAEAEATNASLSPLERMLRSRPPSPPAPAPPTPAPASSPQPSAVPSMIPSQPVTEPFDNPMAFFRLTVPPPQPPPPSTALDCVQSLAKDATLWFYLACYSPVTILLWQQRLQQLTGDATGTAAAAEKAADTAGSPVAWRALIHQLWTALVKANSIDELTAADEREYQAQQQRAAEAAAAAAAAATAAATAAAAATPAAPYPSPVVPPTAAGGYSYAIAPVTALNPAAPAEGSTAPPGMSPFGMSPFGMSPFGVPPAASADQSAVLTMTPAPATATTTPSLSLSLSPMPVAMAAPFPMSMATNTPLAAFNPATATGAAFGGPLASMSSSFPQFTSSYNAPLRPRLRGVPAVVPKHIARALELALRWCFVSGHLPSRWPVLRYLWSEWYLPLLVYRLTVLATQPEAPPTLLYQQMQAVQQLTASLLRIVAVTQHVAPTATVTAGATRPSVDDGDEEPSIVDATELWRRLEAQWQAKVPSPWREAIAISLGYSQAGGSIIGSGLIKRGF